jgi:CheY-like chemotaxis protein
MNSVEISVESEKDVGTTFRLEFIPVTHSTASRPSSSDSVQMEELISEEILDDILVVEDDPSSQLLMEYFLKSRYNLYYAVSVQEAKDVLKKIKPKVVLLDLSLAGQEDGLNLVRDMRKSKEWKSIPVIALTAHAFVSYREQCIKAGCTDYLSKPVKQAALLKRIRQVSSQED